MVGCVVWSMSVLVGSVSSMVWLVTMVGSVMWSMFMGSVTSMVWMTTVVWTVVGSMATVVRSVVVSAVLFVVSNLAAGSNKGWLVCSDTLLALCTVMSVTSANLIKSSGAVVSTMLFTELVEVLGSASGGFQSIIVANNTLEAVVVLASVGSTVLVKSSFTALGVMSRTAELVEPM